MIAIFSSNRTKILTKQAPEDVASDADGVEALPGPLASLLHCLHWRHEHNVQTSRILDTSILWGLLQYKALGQLGNQLLICQPAA